MDPPSARSEGFGGIGVSGKRIHTVTVDDEQQAGAPVVLPLGSAIVGALRHPGTGVLQLVVIYGASATQSMTVGVHVVPEKTGFVPERSRYLATVDGRQSSAAHVFVTDTWPRRTYADLLTADIAAAIAQRNHP